MKVEDYVNGKNQTITNDNATKASEQEELQREGSRTSVIGRRPNIDEISKRNEAEAKQERKSSFVIAGVIALLIVAVIFLVFFFS